MPGEMCAAGPYLLYEDLSKEPREIHWLDLRGRRPRSATEKCVIRIQQNEICNMCVVQNGDEQLLVVGGDGGVLAYNTNTGQRLEWSLTAHFGSTVATDGRSHLFVFDDECIEVYSVSHRCKIGWKAGRTYKIRWCEKSSSLFCIVVCKGCWKQSLNVLHFQMIDRYLSN